MRANRFLLVLCFVVLWWFENWIVDASKNSETFLVLLVFTFINFNRLHFGGVVLIVL